MAVEGLEWAVAPSIYFNEQYEGWGEFCGSGREKYRSPEQWVCIAERLAKKYDGVLPNRTWLRENGYSGLASVIREHQDLFQHIDQDKRFKSADDWVRIAEAIANDNAGRLPSTSWMQANGYGGLYQFMFKNPAMFQHIDQEKPHDHHKSPEEWVPIAEELAKRNEGVLPHGKWLVKNGYSSLRQLLIKYPGMFGHIKQCKKGGRSQGEWVVIAEGLAEQHDGLLPCSRWLSENGYGGLSQAMRKNPDGYVHITQDKPYAHHKSPEEWVTDAEGIAANNSGVLPCLNWLSNNGYACIINAMRRKPQLFEHIPQEMRRTGVNSKVIGIRVNGKIQPIPGDAA